MLENLAHTSFVFPLTISQPLRLLQQILALSSAIASKDPSSIFKHLSLTSSSAPCTRLGLNIKVSLGERSDLYNWKLQASMTAVPWTFNPKPQVVGEEGVVSWRISARDQPASGAAPGPDASNSHGLW